MRIGKVLDVLRQAIDPKKVVKEWIEEQGVEKLIDAHWAAVEKTIIAQFKSKADEQLICDIGRRAIERFLRHIV